MTDPHIVAASLSAGNRPFVLKQGDTFAVFNQAGQMGAGGLGEEGLYHRDTRFLSTLAIEVEGIDPLYLDSTVGLDNDLLSVTMTNPDLVTASGLHLPVGRLHFAVRSFLWRDVLYQQVAVASHSADEIVVAFGWRFAADYADIFDVRAPRRFRRGRDLQTDVQPNHIVLGYEGRDGIRRSTHLRVGPSAAMVSEYGVRLDLHLPPHAPTVLTMSAGCERGPNVAAQQTFAGARSAARMAIRRQRAEQCRIETSNDRLTGWLDRAGADLRTLTTQLPTGPYPYAGLPWFNTPFGRDGLITAWQCLWLDPVLAHGVLAFLASTQATDYQPEQDAEPGKILHETRDGELATVGDIPFARYYGSVDSTPLFVALAGAYFERTADLEFIRSIWPAIEAALAWIERDGDRDGDGFVEYERRSKHGLRHQGWKDSDDAVMHRDGSMATGPIALCEVQGYVYAAWRAGTMLARALGDAARGDRCETRAAALRDRFDDAFWREDIGTYALALDGRKAACAVRSSNAGHCLFGGIAKPARALVVACTLTAADSFSGWGIRTLAAGEHRFNPMGYHSGGVWPHDNSLIAEGLASYGLFREASRLFQAQFDASLHFDLQRMPELFCGFPRQPDAAPMPYPLACAPQAWAAGAAFLMLKASLGAKIDGINRTVIVGHPQLPAGLDTLVISGLDVGGAKVDLGFDRSERGTVVSLGRNDGTVTLVHP